MASMFSFAFEIWCNLTKKITRIVLKSSLATVNCVCEEKRSFTFCCHVYFSVTRDLRGCRAGSVLEEASCHFSVTKCAECDEDVGHVIRSML